MKTTKLKAWIGGTVLMMSSSLPAQIPLTVKTIDEESLLSGRAWRSVDAGTDKETGEPYITYGQPACDMSSEGNWNGGRTYNYRGVAWTFNRFYFDKSLNYIRTEEKSFPTTVEAIKYAPIWGEKFVPMDGDMDVSHGAAGILLSIAGDNASLGAVDMSFLGTTSVTVGMKGLTPTISTVQVYSQVISGANMSSKPTAAQLNSCWESPMSKVLSSEPLKEEKGQKWITVLSNPRPGGGHVLYGTSGVYNEPGKAHYVFRNYNENANVIGEEVIVFDYLALVKGFVLETDQDVADYVLIATSLEYKKSDQKLADPLSVEYLRVDGSTLKVKERFFFKAVTTKWMVEKAIENSGSIYIMGPASNSTTERTTYSTFRLPDHVPNYQVAKISSGQADYVASFGTSDFSSALKSVPDVKGKVAPSLFLYPNGALKYYLKNGRLMITGQQYQTADKYGTFKAFGALVIASISPTGKLEAFYGLPESQTTRGDLFFTKDLNTAYWATYDYKPLNEFVGASVIQKKYPFIASQIRLTKIDLSAAKIVSTQVCGAEVYAPINGKEIMFDSETHVAFNARTLSKKAKDSDITLVMFEK